MPADRSLADGAGDELIGLYERLRWSLLTGMASRLRRSLTNPGDPQGLARRLLAGLDSRLQATARAALERAAERGRAEADAELRTLRRPAPPRPFDVAARLFELAGSLRSTHPQVVRWAGSAYRDVLLAASTGEGGTRLQQAQRTWQRLVDRGITGFRDTRGRRWELASYVEMATRSRLADTAVTAHLDRLAAADIDLVVVSDAPGECEICRRFEGRVLSRTGAARGPVQVEHGTRDGHMVTVDVLMSVAEAKAAGLLHRNCRHSLSTFIPGVTKTPTHTSDPAGAQARERQRAIERQIRAWKLRGGTALDPAAAKVARARVSAWQAQMRAHLAAHPELRRQSSREQIGAAR